MLKKFGNRKKPTTFAQRNGKGSISTNVLRGVAQSG